MNTEKEKNTAARDYSYILLPATRRNMDLVLENCAPGTYTTITIDGHNAYCYIPGQKSSSIPELLPRCHNGIFSLEDPGAQHKIYRSGGLELDCAAGTVTKNGIELHLPAVQLTLLKVLMMNGPVYLSRKTLIKVLERRLAHMVKDNTLNVHISRLRRALGSCEDTPYISKACSQGYCWNLQVYEETLPPILVK